MWRYIFHRLLLLIPTLLGVLVITFAVIQFALDGPMEQMVQQLTQGAIGNGMAGRNMSGVLAKNGNRISAEDLAMPDALYGFGKSPLTRFTDVIWRFARFDLGGSFLHRQTVSELMKEKTPVSTNLGLWTFFLTYLICIPLGIAKAVRDGSRFDTITGMITLAGYTVLSFALGLVLLVLFGGGSFLVWFPQGDLVGDDLDTLSWAGKVRGYLWCIALPIAASVAGNLAVMTVLTKNVSPEEIRRQYVYTAWVKGSPEKQILWEHVFRSAMTPLVTGSLVALTGVFLTGNPLIEILFSSDGLGLLSYGAVMKRDYPVVMGTLCVFTLVGLLAKLVSDISYPWVDPCVHFGKQK